MMDCKHNTNVSDHIESFTGPKRDESFANMYRDKNVIREILTKEYSYDNFGFSPKEARLSLEAKDFLGKSKAWL